MMLSRFDPTTMQVVLESSYTFPVILDGGATARVLFPSKLFTPFIPGAGIKKRDATILTRPGEPIWVPFKLLQLPKV
jgi:hypothetical protein